MSHLRTTAVRSVARVAWAWIGAMSISCGAGHGTIGALLGQQQSGRLFIRDTPAHLAAYEKGLRPGDEVLLIDGRDVRTMDARALHEALSGEVGTKVKLTAVRGEEVIRVTLVRKPVPSPKKNETKSP